MLARQTRSLLLHPHLLRSSPSRQCSRHTGVCCRCRAVLRHSELLSPAEEARSTRAAHLSGAESPGVTRRRDSGLTVPWGGLPLPKAQHLISGQGKDSRSGCRVAPRVPAAVDTASIPCTPSVKSQGSWQHVELGELRRWCSGCCSTWFYCFQDQSGPAWGSGRKMGEAGGPWWPAWLCWALGSSLYSS